MRASVCGDACAAGRLRRDAETQREVYAMDTVMTLTAYGKKADAGLRAAESIISSMDAALDPELSTSTTYAINHAQGGSTVISGQIAKC